MNICIVVPDYPDEKRSSFTFVKQLVNELAKFENVHCTVIAPYSVTKNKSFSRYREIQYSKNGFEIEILRPNYISFSNIKIMGIHLSSVMHAKAVKRTLKSMQIIPDVIYTHFWISGLEAFDYALVNNIPLFVATGESNIPMSVVSNKFKTFYSYVSGVICVSTKNKKESISLGLADSEKCIVLPNAINTDKFKLLDKKECRLELGFPETDFIVAYVGWFDERKGCERVSKAIDLLNDNSIKSIFIGSGSLKPTCKGIIFQGVVSHDLIPKYLNCADVFVLPTLREGCCNAIIEALSCGLPVISSNLQFNWDVLNSQNALLIDPMNIDEIAKAISIIKNDKMLRYSMHKAALQSAKKLTINNRAKSIIDFIQSRIY